MHVSLQVCISAYDPPIRMCHSERHRGSISATSKVTWEDIHFVPIPYNIAVQKYISHYLEEKTAAAINLSLSLNTEYVYYKKKNL